MKKENKTTKPAARCDKCSAPISMEFRIQELEKKVSAALSLIDSSNYRIDKIKEHQNDIIQDISRLRNDYAAVEYAKDQIEEVNKKISGILDNIHSIYQFRIDSLAFMEKVFTAFVVIYLAVILLTLCVIRF